MLAEIEIIPNGFKPFSIEKNIDEFLSVPHIKKVLLLDAIKQYGVDATEIEEEIVDVYEVKGLDSSRWKYFNKMKIEQLLPLNNIIINELRPQELRAFNQMFEISNQPVDCLEQVLIGNYYPMEIAIKNYIYSATNGELIYLLKDILHSNLSIEDIKTNPEQVLELLEKITSNLKETFLQTIRQTTEGIVIL
jgi:hypothetical protein